MFVIHYYCGEYEEARKYLQQMGNAAGAALVTVKNAARSGSAKGIWRFMTATGGSGEVL